MKDRRQTIALVASLALICIGAVVLGWLNGHHKLGTPAVKTSPLPGTKNLLVELPERVLDYESKIVPTDKIVLDFLPRDTSYGSRRYTAPDDFSIVTSVVLMGADRTSLHKPQFCLEGQGWSLDPLPSSPNLITVERPQPYELPVIKLTASKAFEQGGQRGVARGIFVFWYVADGEVSASTSGIYRMWSMARDLVQKGELQRWAYISYFSVCVPGQEEATFERMKKLIAASVPEFQLTPKPAPTALTARQ